MLSFDFQNYVLDLNSADVASGKYAMWSQSVEQCNKIMTSSRNDTDVTCLQIFLLEFLEIIVPQLELSHANHFAIFEIVVSDHFYWTRVRSLAMLVTHSLTDSLTDSCLVNLMAMNYTNCLMMSQQLFLRLKNLKDP